MLSALLQRSDWSELVRILYLIGLEVYFPKHNFKVFHRKIVNYYVQISGFKNSMFQVSFVLEPPKGKTDITECIIRNYIFCFH